MLHRRLTLALASFAVLLAAFGTIASATAVPEPGYQMDFYQTEITAVQPGSLAWRDGFRIGAVVMDIVPADDPQYGTGLRATLGQGSMEYRPSLAVTWLRSTRDYALFGAAITILALVLLLRSERIGLALIPVGLAWATVPLIETGIIGEAVLGGAVLVLVAAACVTLTTTSARTRAMAVALGVSYAILWVVAMGWVPDLFDPVDATRFPAALGFTVWAGWLTVDRRALREQLIGPGGPQAFDLMYLPIVAAVLAAAVLFARVDWSIAAVAGLVALLVFPFSRRLVGEGMERLVVGRLRREAGIHAIEEERGRLAREIHDAPLQELAAVIRRLDAVPAAAGETSVLRQVAAQLRDVATTLRPPVLEDLGLVAALEDLGETLRAANPGWTIEVETDDLTLGGPRPDADVEVAAYRVVQEAAGNALRHSGGRTLSIVASVGTDAIDLTVADDGTGIDRNEAVAARRRGHFGLDSMRDRAEAVGARLLVASGETGARIRYVWERPA